MAPRRAVARELEAAARELEAVARKLEAARQELEAARSAHDPRDTDPLGCDFARVSTRSPVNAR